MELSLPGKKRPVHWQRRRRLNSGLGRVGVGWEVAWYVASAGGAAVTLLSQPGSSAGAASQYVFQGTILLAEQLVDLILLVFR